MAHTNKVLMCCTSLVGSDDTTLFLPSATDATTQASVSQMLHSVSEYPAED